MKNKQNVMYITQSRTDAYLTLTNKEVIALPIGTTLEDALDFAKEQGLLDKNNHRAIAAVCNGKLRELTYKVEGDCQIRPIYESESDGARIYRRSLVFLMTRAIADLYPNAQVSVDYSVPDGGYYCEMYHHDVLTQDELQQLREHMTSLVEQNIPITKTSVSIDTAQKQFEDRHNHDKVRLLEFRTSDSLTLYELDGYQEYYYGYMVPSTGYLQYFNLLPAKRGFILQYPRRENPHTLPAMKIYPKLDAVFQQANDWLERLGVEDIGRLNRLVSQDAMQEIILVAEALHEQNIAQIANQICEQQAKGVQLVLIAGPSSSGKTTFAKRLAIQLLAHGLRPFTLEMDNYFVNREDTPRDEQGDYNFESLQALKLTRLNQDLLRLMQGDEVTLPKFDFHAGRSQDGDKAKVMQGQIIIMEGIHGLNPDLVPDIPNEKIFRIYVSALTQLNIDMHNRVPTTDVRLLRRLVRDARSRGYQAVDTLMRWRSVRLGEKQNIFPYQENADAIFNSALVYELAALRPIAEPLLLQVPPYTPAHLEANRLLSFLNWVYPMRPDQVKAIPDTSLLREFVGGSVLDHYHPSQLQAMIEHMR
jgi:uridine kinase